MKAFNSSSVSFIPTPALSFIGRKNSGKTTLLEKIISELSTRKFKIATVKHHGHPDFDIDIPGRDSYRHRMAGAQSTTILSDIRFAQVTDLTTPITCEEVLCRISNYDITLVEGFKKAALPHIELFRDANPRDKAALESSIQTWENTKKDGGVLPVALISDIPRIQTAANNLGIPLFDFEDIADIATFIQNTFMRPRLSVVVQAGGESKRMSKPKDVVSFLGQPLITHAVRRVAPLANELIVTTNHPDRLNFLKKTYPTIRFVKDILPQRGALPGLYTALSSASNNIVALIACDMVDAPTTLLAKEALLMRPQIATSCDSEYDAIVPQTETGIEPFAAVYRKTTCLRTLESFVQNNKIQGRMRDFLDTLNSGYFDCTHPHKRAQLNGSFLNINTPEDLKLAEDAFTQKEGYLS